MIASVLAAATTQAANDEFARKLDELSRAFRGGGEIATEFQASWLLIVMGSLALVSVAAWIGVSLVRHDRARHGPALRLLAAGLGLRFTERRLAVKLAAVSGFRSPAALLISRGCFERAAEQYLAQRPRAGSAVAALRAATFE